MIANQYYNLVNLNKTLRFQIEKLPHLPQLDIARNCIHVYHLKVLDIHSQK